MRPMLIANTPSRVTSRPPGMLADFLVWPPSLFSDTSVQSLKSLCSHQKVSSKQRHSPTSGYDLILNNHTRLLLRHDQFFTHLSHSLLSDHPTFRRCAAWAADNVSKRAMHMKIKGRHLGTGSSQCQICRARRVGLSKGQTCIHARSGIRIHGISVRFVEDCTTAASVFVISHFTFLKRTP
jgi:hypothetical protein